MKKSLVVVFVVHIVRCMLVSALPVKNGRSYDTINIQQINGLDKKIDFTTSAEGDQLALAFSGFGQSFHLKLQKNTLLLSKDAKLIHQGADGSHVTKDEDFEQCYYHGGLLDEESSSVVLSTCGGRLNGFLKDSNGVEFVIAPHPHSEVKHVLYRGSDVVKRNGTVHRRGIGTKQLPHSQLDERSPSHHIKKRSATTSVWKYIEVIPVVSHRLYQRFRDAGGTDEATLKLIKQKVLHYMNIVDSYYKTINTRVVVTNLIVWDRNDNFMDDSFGVDASLDSFTRYVFSDIYARKNLRYDHVSLLTVEEANWGGAVGHAYVGHMCNVLSTSVNKVMLGNPDHITAHIIAHEMGHSIGLPHTSECASGNCQNPPCLMQAIQPMVPTKSFSQCITDLYENLIKAGKLPCLLMQSEKNLQPPKCGNGIVDDGGDCDCETEEKCWNQAYSCKFVSGDGIGGSEIHIGSPTGEMCIHGCLSIQKNDKRINGVTIRKDGKDGCYCEMGMKKVAPSKTYKTCFLSEKVKDTKCTFVSGDGVGGSERRIGSQTGDDCIHGCLSMQKNDKRVNGVTVRKDGKDGCYCEMGMEKVAPSKNYKTCFLDQGVKIESRLLLETDPTLEKTSYLYDDFFPKTVQEKRRKKVRNV